MHLGLRFKFLATTIALIIIGMAVSTVVSVRNSRSTIGRVSQAQQQQLVAMAIDQVEAWVTNRKLEIRYWGKQDIYNIAIDGAFRKMANKELGELASDYVFYEVLSVAGADGLVVASSRPEEVDTANLSDRDYFAKSLAGEVYVSPVVRSKASGEPVFVVSAPVLRDDMPVGVLCGVIRMSYFNTHFIDPMAFGTSGYVFMCDSSGSVVSHPDDSFELQNKITDREFGAAMMANRAGSITYEFADEERSAAYGTSDMLGWLVAATITTSELNQPSRQLGQVNLVIALVVILFAVVIVFLIARSIVNPIYKNIEVLEESSELMSASAGQVSHASQDLARSASEQASSLEETSASLEQLSSMSRQNSSSAQKARTLTLETKQTAAQGAESMERLTTAMQAINQSSSEVASVAKGIEEIAFQTNLLALNAAVEAARAGEAGKGFAVVAEEVRNLAQRSAEQAKTTSELISESTNRVGYGAEQADEAGKSLASILESVNKVVGIVEEIANASDEQARGVTQISDAVSQMDQIVQNNSAASEESASSSQEMAGQAAELKTVVRTLTMIIEGRETAATAARNTPAAPARTAPARATAHPALQAGDEDVSGFEDF